MRIRTLKPEFWSDEKLGPMSPIVRLVFLGLISHADDAGRLIDSVKQLDGLLFPYTDDSTEESLRILAESSRILRYSSESGQRLIQIVGWDKHQRVDKPCKYVLPAPPPEPVAPQQVSPPPQNPRGNSVEAPQNPRDPTLDLRPTTKDQGPPTASGARTEFSTWLGDRADCLAAIEYLTAQAIWGIWGPHGTQAHDWKGMAEDRQRHILANTILTYAAEGKRGFHRRFFTAILVGAIDDAIASDRQAEQRGTEEATASAAREAARLHEQREIERLNAEAAKGGTGPVSIPQAKPVRSGGLARLSA